MCGIAGRFHPVQLVADPAWHEKADRLLAHRGPDSNGYFADDRCELVHRRLALIDLSPTGYQPLTNEDGTILIIFNGEVYNHQPLREQLKSKGHLFRGSSDTEVLVHLYEEYGHQMIHLIRGMFAFAIYDQPKQQLMLARDRFGIKPLYYAERQDQLVFASEMKAILALSGFNPTMDRQACYDYLGLCYIPEPFTGFNEIRLLPKGSSLLVNQSGNHLINYYQPEVSPDNDISLDEISEKFALRLTQAIQEQSIADVTVAALLSGGIDSSLVVAGYCRGSETNPITFNVRFPDRAYDETDMAHAVSHQYNTRHHTVDIEEKDFTPEIVLKLLRHFDQPFADTSLIPVYWISRAIRDRGIICALSGDGGDEAFGGYARFWRANQLARLMTFPSFFQNMMIFAGDKLSHRTRDLGRQLSKAVHLAQVGERDTAILMAGLSNYLSESQKEELVNPDARHDLHPVYRHFGTFTPQGTNDLNELSARMTRNLFEVSLPGDMLRKVDMMTMLSSIEVRVPLLDYELVDQALKLPHRLKTDGHKGKLVLRKIAEKWLPAQVAHHPKQGFSIPLDKMVKADFHHMLADFLLSAESRTRSLINPGLVEQWLQLFKVSPDERRDGTISRGGLYQRIIILLSLEVWMREYNLTW